MNSKSFIKFLIAILVVLLFTLVSLHVAKRLGNAYASAVPPSLAALHKALILSARTDDWGVFGAACFLSSLIAIAFFTCGVLLIKLTNFALGGIVVAAGVEASSVAVLSMIAEVAAPLAAVTVVFSLAIFFFHLEKGIKIPSYFRWARAAPLLAEDAA